MKILALRGAGIGSLLKEFCVDFEKAPLRNCGLFAITGPTGSGKSKLLDAMCLALFNNSPRLKKSGGNKFDQTDLSPNDPRTLLNKDAQSAYAEVDFLGVDLKKYRARWSVRRLKKSKKDGGVAKVEMRLTEILGNFATCGAAQQAQARSATLISQGYKETLALIAQKIGCDFAQFTKTVLLAQNDFAAFLGAKDDERAQILQMLTDSTIFEKISIAAHLKHKEVSARFKELTAQMDAQKIPTEKEKDDLKKEIADILQKKSTLTVEKEHLEQQKTWILQLNDLNNLFLKAEKDFLLLKEEWENNLPKIAQLKRKKNAFTLKPLWIQKEETHKQFSENEQAIFENNQKIVETQNTLQNAEKHLIQSKKVLADFEVEIKSKANDLEKAKGLDEQLLKIKTEIQKEEEFLHSILAQNKKAKDDSAQIQKAMIEKESQMENLKEYFAKKQKHLLLENVWDKVENLLKSFNFQYLQDLEKSIVEKESQLSKKENDFALIQKDFNSAKTAFESSQQTLKNQIICELSLGLQDGKSCPVCGSAKHPAPFHLNVENKNAELLDLENLKKNVEATESAFSKAEKELLLFKENLKHLKENYENQKKSLSDSLNALNEYLLPIASDWQNRFLNNPALFLENSAKNVAQCRTQKKLEESLKNDLFLLQNNYENASKIILKNKNSLEEKELFLKEKNNVFENIQKERCSLFEGKSVSEIQNTWHFEENQLKNNAWQAKNEKDLLLKSLAIYKKNNDDLQIKSAELKNALATFTHQFEKALKDYDFSKEEIKALFLQDQQEVQAQYHQTLKIEEEKNSAELLKNTRQKDLEKHEKTNPFENAQVLNLDEINALLNEKKAALETSESLLAKRQAQAGELEAQGRAAETLRQAVLEAQEEASLWAGMNDLLGAYDGKVFRDFAQRYTLDALVLHANSHLQKLWRRYALKRAPESLALWVVDLAAGGVPRSVHSLSGGESFLVSLSLALGLATLKDSAQLSDSLFIDEGFGALDKESLALVMNALENLHAAGRTVGVISHIEEMCERIAVRVLVKPNDLSGSSNLEIVGE